MYFTTRGRFGISFFTSESLYSRRSLFLSLVAKQTTSRVFITFSHQRLINYFSFQNQFRASLPHFMPLELFAFLFLLMERLCY